MPKGTTSILLFVVLSLRSVSLSLSLVGIKKPPSTTDAWDSLAGNIANCLIQSDLKRDSGFDGSSTGWTSWVEGSSASILQKCIDNLVFVDSSKENKDNTESQDESIRWIKWLKASPTPIMLECSEQLQDSVFKYVTDKDLERVGQTKEEFRSRIACRVIVLPSGTSLVHNLRTAPGGMIYGKLLYGGVTRYRIIAKNRKAGERTLIDSTESWLQYGGPERNYNAVDMGPCALMELILLPKGLQLPLLHEDDLNEEMIVATNQNFNLNQQFGFIKETNNSNVKMLEESQQQNQVVNYNFGFSSILGGLDTQIEAIVRRVLEGRAQIGNTDENEVQAMIDLGLHPVKGLLLHGPPGNGKTALAREISRLLTERPPKIVAAPELLDRWIGGSEKLVRDLFGDAEEELKFYHGDFTKSGLHVIVIDEVDAVFRKRSSASDSGEVTRASAVNQILSKLDGVNALGNILVIGTTNRKELLDSALLRPGRLEVQVHIPLPDAPGRRQILQIHFAALRKRGRLSQPLLKAIDGHDLAFRTKGFSGADLEGLVRCAGSLALSRARIDGSGIDGLVITLEDVLNGIVEMKRQ